MSTGTDSATEGRRLILIQQAHPLVTLQVAYKMEEILV